MSRTIVNTDTTCWAKSSRSTNWIPKVFFVALFTTSFQVTLIAVQYCAASFHTGPLSHHHHHQRHNPKMRASSLFFALLSLSKSDAVVVLDEEELGRRQLSVTDNSFRVKIGTVSLYRQLETDVVSLTDSIDAALTSTPPLPPFQRRFVGRANWGRIFAQSTVVVRIVP